MDVVTAALCPTVLCCATPELEHALRRARLPPSLAGLVAPLLPRDRLPLRLPSTYEQRTHCPFRLALVDHVPVPVPGDPATPHHHHPAPPYVSARDELFLDRLGQRVHRDADASPPRTAPYARVRDAVLTRRRNSHRSDPTADDPDDGDEYTAPPPHDSFAHPVAVLVALSTAHPDPLNALADLWALASDPARLYPPADPRRDAAPPDLLRFVLLVHDRGAHPPADIPDDADVARLYQTIRKTYGVHTALVPLFSAAPTALHPEPPAPDAAALWPELLPSPAPSVAAPPVVGLGFDVDADRPAEETGAGAAPTPASHPPPPPGHELSSADLDALRAFAREFVVQSLIPYLERQGVVLHEQWQAGRRGLGGRLFNVGRKYFGGGNGGSGASSAAGSREASPALGASAASKEGYQLNKGLYHHSSPVALARRLADTAFYLGDYRLAYTVYEAYAKDVRTDKAWRHCATALRMQGLCALLLLPPPPPPPMPIDDALLPPRTDAVLAPPSSPAPPPPPPPPSQVTPHLLTSPDALLAQAAAVTTATTTTTATTLVSPLADLDALRATLLYCELYRAHAVSTSALGPVLAPLAPLALVRAAGDAEETVAAVLLEEAAWAHLRAPLWPGQPPPWHHGRERRQRRLSRGSTTAGELDAGKTAYAPDAQDSLLLEVGGGRTRKFAFWMALAAARYEKCGVKSLSRRCLSHALTVFPPTAPVHPVLGDSPSEAPAPPPVTSFADPRDPPPPLSGSGQTDSPPPPPPWSAIRTHLHHSLARQSYTVGAARESVDHFLALLDTGAAGPPVAVAAAGGGDGAGEGEGVAGAAGGDVPEWLDDFALAWELLQGQAGAETQEKEGEEVTLPVRLVDAARARLLPRARTGRSTSGPRVEAWDEDDSRWKEVERALLARAEWRPRRGEAGAAGGRPSALTYCGSTGSSVVGQGQRGRLAGGRAVAGAEAAQAIEAVLGEQLVLELPVRNPLEAFLALGALAVGVQRERDGDEPSEDSGLEVCAPHEVELAPGETSKILVPVRATALGTYTFDSISYRFSNLVPVREPLSAARWSKPTRPQPGAPSTRVPLPLRLTVRPPVPVLSVQTDQLPSKLFQGEHHLSGADAGDAATIVLRNEGSVPLTDLHALGSDPDLLLLLSPHDGPRADPAPVVSAETRSEGGGGDLLLRLANDLVAPNPTTLLPPGRSLAPGETLSVPVLMRGSSVGAHTLRILFAFRAAEVEGVDAPGPAPEYFAARAVHRLEVYPSLQVQYTLRPGRKEGVPLMLTVQVQNIGLPADDVCVSGVSILSPRWRIGPSVDAAAFVDDVAGQRIGWQQGLALRVPLAAEEDVAATAEAADLWTVGQMEALLDGKEVKGAPPPCSLALSSWSDAAGPNPVIPPADLPGLLASYRSYRCRSLAQHHPTVPPALHPSLFPLFASRSAVLILTFTSPTLALTPAAHLILPLDAPPPGTALGSPASAALGRVLANAERRAGGGLYEESRRERRALLTALRTSDIVGGHAPASVAGPNTAELPPVTVDLVVEGGTLEHDFSTGPLSLPLRISLFNLSVSTAFAYTLSLSAASDSATTGGGGGGEDGGSGGGAVAILCGARTHRGTLPPLGTAQVTAQLWISRPGTFTAGAWDLVLSWSAPEGQDRKEQAGTVRLSGPGRQVRVRDCEQASREA